MKPGQLSRVLLISVDAPGHYSLALPLLKGYAELDEVIRKTTCIRIVRIKNIGRGSRVIRAVLGAVLRFRPQMVGFSCNIWNALVVRRCCRWIRRCLPRTLLLLGGQEICSPLEEVIDTYPFAQILIPGAGEAPFRSLLRNIIEYGSDGLDRSRGIYFKKEDGHWQMTSAHQEITRLDEIPSAYLTGNVVMPENPRMGAMIELTRGCPLRCGFCYEANRMSRPMKFSFERVAEEIRWLRSRGYKRFHILDPILCFGRRLQELHEVLSRSDMDNTHISAEIYAEHIRKEDQEALHFITDYDVGLQTTSTRALRILQRQWRREKFEQGFRILQNTGKVVSCYIMVGLPGDNLNGFRKSLDYTMGLRPTKLFCNPLLVLRGTAIRHHANDYGLHFNPDPPYEALECNTFPRDELNRAKAFGQLMMNTYNTDRRA